MTKMSSEISTHVQSIIADSLTNLSSKNPNFPSQHIREEGWTEVFGNKKVKGKEKGIVNSHPSKSFEPANIQIIQYRMAWTTQLILRIYALPHTVHNSPYVSNQSTGALPQYRNLSEQILIGNHDIFSYLIDHLNVDKNLLLNRRSECQCLSSVLDQQDFLLRALRYGDRHAWEQIYRKQCIQGTKLHMHSQQHLNQIHINEEEEKGSAGRWNGYAWFQAWAERVVNLKEIKLGNGASGLGSGFRNLFTNENRDLDVKVATEMARQGYLALDSKLEVEAGTLLGTESLTSVDIRLFGHLAESFCDVNLVTVLAEMKNLVLFFQEVYEKYFGKAYFDESIMDGADSDADSDTATNDIQAMKENFSWIKSNDQVNALNQFNPLPMNSSFSIKTSSNGNAYQDAFKIMQSVALHCHDLQEVLVDMALEKKREDDLIATTSVGDRVGSLLNRIRMGGELNMKTSKDDSNDDSDDDDEGDDIMKKNRQRLKKLLRETKKNDELWISGVLCATIVGLLASTHAASNS